MALQPTQIPDYVKATLPVFRKGIYKDISLNLQRYEWVSRYLKSSKAPTAGGQYLEETFKVANAGSARYTGLFQGRNLVIGQHLVKITVPWAMFDANWSFDIRENDFQGDAATILRVTKVRQQGMYCDWVEFVEQQMWRKADGPTSEQIFGIPTWMVKGSNDEFEFGGGDPAGFSAGVGGLSTVEYRNWGNGTFKYNLVSNGDLFKKWAEAATKCYFEPPYAYEGESVKGRPRYVYHTTYPVVSAIHDFLTSANDNLRTDAGMYRGKVLFKGAPVIDVPALTNEESDAYDTQHPIYGIDWSKFGWFFLKGWDGRLTGPKETPNQTHGRFVQIDGIGNFIHRDRRSCFVGHTTTFAQ